MPVTYSFVTSLFIPTSPEWPCADFGSAAIQNLLLFPETTANRGAPWIVGNVDRELVFTSDDNLPTWLRFELPFADKYTFQTQFKPSSLPDDLLRLDKFHCF